MTWKHQRNRRPRCHMVLRPISFRVLSNWVGRQASPLPSIVRSLALPAITRIVQKSVLWNVDRITLISTSCEASVASPVRTVPIEVAIFRNRNSITRIIIWPVSATAVPALTDCRAFKISVFWYLHRNAIVALGSETPMALPRPAIAELRQKPIGWQCNRNTLHALLLETTFAGPALAGGMVRQVSITYLCP